MSYAGIRNVVKYVIKHCNIIVYWNFCMCESSLKPESAALRNGGCFLLKFFDWSPYVISARALVICDVSLT